MLGVLGGAVLVSTGLIETSNFTSNNATSVASGTSPLRSTQCSYFSSLSHKTFSLYVSSVLFCVAMHELSTNGNVSDVVLLFGGHFIASSYSV